MFHDISSAPIVPYKSLGSILSTLGSPFFWVRINLSSACFPRWLRLTEWEPGQESALRLQSRGVGFTLQVTKQVSFAHP